MGPARESVRAHVGDIAAIEGLRGVAVAWVVLFHYFVVRAGHAPDPWNAFVASHRALAVVVGNGFLGVDLFFLITGFLLVLPWERRRRLGLGAPDARAFYARRVRRIAPAYYVQLGALFFVFLPLLWSVDSWRVDRAYLATNLAAHAVFMHYTNPVTSGSVGINGALWTLALEVQYYALLPLFAAAFVRAPARWIVGFAAIAIAWRVAANHGLGPLVAFEMQLGARRHVPEEAVRHLLETQLPGYLAHFGLGIGLGLAWMRWREAPGSRATRIASGIVACAAVLGLVALYARWSGGDPAWAWLATVLLLCGVLQFPLVGAQRFGNATLGNRALRAAGRVSYSVYLYHLPVIYLWNKGHVLDGSALSMPACMVAIAAIAAASYGLVERPFLARSPAAPLVTAAA